MAPPRNSARSPGGLIARIVLAFAILLAAGCSVVGTLYGQLDRLIVMQADSWLALDAEQKTALRAAVEASVERHRTEELPAWVALLRRIADFVEAGRPDDEALLAEMEHARVLTERSTRLLLRPAAEALARLGPAQIEHLVREMDEDNAEFAEEFLDPAPERRTAARVQRTREAIERWSGRLDAAQRAQVAELMASVPDGAEAWRDYRRAWQDALLARLEAGDGADALERLLHDWWIGDAGMDPAYAEQLDRNRAVIAEGLAALFAGLSPAQRERAARRLRDVATDLEELGPASA